MRRASYEDKESSRTCRAKEDTDLPLTEQIVASNKQQPVFSDEQDFFIFAIGTSYYVIDIMISFSESAFIQCLEHKNRKM